jgi:hypothetical protein
MSSNFEQKPPEYFQIGANTTKAIDILRQELASLRVQEATYQNALKILESDDISQLESYDNLLRTITNLQEQLATYQNSMDLLDNEIETIHRDHRQEVEQYQLHLREMMDERNQMQEINQQWESRYKELSHSFQDASQEGTHTTIPGKADGDSSQRDSESTGGSTIRLLISEDPLALSTLASALSALTELSTKYWLIAQARFADLIEYTQTHNERFLQEAGITLGALSHNSPMNFDVRFGATDVAEAIAKTIDGIAQAKQRYTQKELEIKAQVQALEQNEREAEEKQLLAQLERERQQLDIEQKRLEIIEKQLEIQKQTIEFALDLAGKILDGFQPGLDPAARAMAIQVSMSNILQLNNIPGLDLSPLLLKEANSKPVQEDASPQSDAEPEKGPDV